VSKTIDRPVEEVWTYITSPAGIAIWLGEGVTTTLQLAVRSAGAGRRCSGSTRNAWPMPPDASGSAVTGRA
jgi:uncharacterized protein YndB with AHSA1/START domain